MQLFGAYHGEEVYVVASAGVETNALGEDGFYGKCALSTPEIGPVDGYCLGHFPKERLYAFSPEEALDLEWPPMEGSIGALIEQDASGEITLTREPEMQVGSLSQL